MWRARLLRSSKMTPMLSSSTVFDFKNFTLYAFSVVPLCLNPFSGTKINEKTQACQDSHIPVPGYTRLNLYSMPSTQRESNYILWSK
ncbi:MAG: hypothetical protein DRH32_04310 [Deltaproteobacteria bacterium]|nr:MAG: hypothetical protein DRH32_04310 [Deltaproteobacteria bacterium]